MNVSRFAKVAAALRTWTGMVRVRITLFATVAVALALTAAGVALVVLQERALTDNVDATVRLRADDVAALLASGNAPDVVTVGDDEVAGVQVLDADGVVVAASRALTGQPPISSLRPAPGSTASEDRDDLPIDDQGFRVIARTVETPSGRFTLLVAGSLEDVAESGEALTGLLQAGIPIVVVIVALGTWLLVGRALAPVEAIRREVAGIGGDDLARRVPEPAAGDEVGMLARTMNGMLARLQAARERQDQFVADAAHELRSPLASMRLQVEVDLPPTGTREELAREIVRMQRLVNDLLVLAREDGAGEAATAMLVDLDDVVLGEARRARAGAGGVSIDTSSVSAAAVRGDAETLRRAVRNLLENAVRHARSAVRLELSEADGEVTLAVSDDGPGIPVEDHERVFERFARTDAARSGDGTGLGLAITRSIVEAHGGRVWVEAAHEGGARFVMRLPGAG